MQLNFQKGGRERFPLPRLLHTTYRARVVRKLPGTNFLVSACLLLQAFCFPPRVVEYFCWGSELFGLLCLLFFGLSLLAYRVVFVLRPTRPLSLLPRVIHQRTGHPLARSHGLLRPIVYHGHSAMLIPSLVRNTLGGYVHNLVNFHMSRVRVIVFASNAQIFLTLMNVGRCRRQATLMSLVVARGVRGPIPYEVGVSAKGFIWIFPYGGGVMAIRSRVFFLQFLHQVSQVTFFVVFCRVQLQHIKFLFRPLTPLLVFRVLTTRTGLTNVGLLRLLVRFPTNLTKELLPIRQAGALPINLVATPIHEYLNFLLQRGLPQRVRVVVRLVPQRSGSNAVHARCQSNQVYHVHFAIMSNFHSRFLAIIASVVAKGFRYRVPRSANVYVCLATMILRHYSQGYTLRRNMIRTISNTRFQQVGLTYALLWVNRNAASRLLQRFGHGYMCQFRRCTFHTLWPLPSHTMDYLPRVATLNIFSVNASTWGHSFCVNRY